jgi:hypothetical protein
MRLVRACGGMEGIGLVQVRRKNGFVMSLDPDPDAPPGTDRTLWIGLSVLFLSLLALAIAVQKLVPGASGGLPSSPPPSESPLMTRPQLLENQQAMPELGEFDGQSPAQAPINGNTVLGSQGVGISP